MNKNLKALGALMLMMTAWIVVGCQPDDTNPYNEMRVDGVYKGHDYVDLGLPSGTMWATCNVGASRPEKHGDYFAWGETQPKACYDSDTYKYYKLKEWTSNWQLTKYCNDPEYGYQGYSDTLTMLQPDDDAATVNWGEGWQTPTAEQWRELLEYTSASRTCLNGVNGLLFHGFESNTLFIPAAGYREDRGEDLSDLHDPGLVLEYWSNTLYTDTLDEWWATPELAWLFIYDFYYDFCECDVVMGERHYGCPVRAVCAAP